MDNITKLNLYSHNIIASKKAKKAFNDGQQAVSIIHATGTGKTYNALFLALEYKNQNIVWLVPTNAIKEHIEQTINNNPNLNMERDFPNLEIRTYSSLIAMQDEDIKNIACDFLIVDEFHHLGAPVWGQKVTTFIENHPNIKLFGMTAYNVRDRGTIYERDMTNEETSEIFSNTTVSTYDIYDAIVDGVLPKPIVKAIVTEESSLITEIKEMIELKKIKGDTSYRELEIAINNTINLIHKEDLVRKIVQQTVKQNGKYIYFCPVLSEEGKNDINSIMESIKGYLQEKFPSDKIIFYKSTSSDGEIGKRNRECFYNDTDLDGHDVSNAIRIIFVKNQYNEGVHAPNVDGVFLGRKTKSDIVAFEQIGRALFVRGNIHQNIEEYLRYSIEEIRDMAKARKIQYEENDSKETIIEKLLSPTIIDLADNISFLEELETNLGIKVRESQQKVLENKRNIHINSAFIDVEIINKDIYDLLLSIRKRLQSKTWNDWYQLLEAYYQYYGNAEVPQKFKTINGYDYDEKGFSLGIWCHNQRANKDNLSYDKINKFKQINFRLEKELRIIEWEEKYQLALEYYNHYGHSEIPARFKTKNGIDYDDNGTALGRWCDKQRQRIEKLDANQKEKLQKILFRFETKKKVQYDWEEYYKLALAYYNYYGHSEIPAKFKTTNGKDYDSNGINLGVWCLTQRYRSDKLTEEKRNKLEKINFNFNIKKIHNQEWEEYYQLALAYYNKNGHSEIPSKFKTKNGIDYDKDGINLGGWCDRQRQRQDGLTQDKKEKLNAIKFRFTTNLDEIQWNNMYELAKIYYKYHGHSNAPQSFKTKNGIDYDETGLSLGSWLSTQRQTLKKLSEERKEKLNQIELVKNVKDLTWEKMYQLALAYYNHHGTSEIPSQFKTINGYEYNPNGYNLGIWCDSKRRNQQALNEDKKRKLDVIGFRYTTKVENQNKKKILCQTNGIDYNKYSVLEKLSYQELYAKIMFLNDMGYPLEINNNLHETFYMSNENMLFKYKVSKEELISTYYINLTRK